jgi:hypothetical protein
MDADDPDKQWLRIIKNDSQPERGPEMFFVTTTLSYFHYCLRHLDRLLNSYKSYLDSGCLACRSLHHQALSQPKSSRFIVALAVKFARAFNPAL